MKRRLTIAEVNHLRRLLGWIGCEIGPAPDSLVETARRLAPALAPDIDPAAKRRLEDAYRGAAAIPGYVRAAVKALTHAIAEEVETVDGQFTPRARVIRGRRALPP